MNWVDRALQRARTRHAARCIPSGTRVLDIGCFDDALFRRLGPRLGSGVAIDPSPAPAINRNDITVMTGSFPDVDVPTPPFDVVTMLAVIEHVAADQVEAWVRRCREVLVPGGLVVGTMPSPAVDTILEALIRFRVLDGMEAGQHHGLEPDHVREAFQHQGFTLVRWKRFQLGLNNLFVFKSPPPT
jgi:2-polyprenyl-3-methyl-5-hydroxy-6-metoxy-1,4-benzoquinol methylase